MAWPSCFYFFFIHVIFFFLLLFFLSFSSFLSNVYYYWCKYDFFFLRFTPIRTYSLPVHCLIVQCICRDHSVQFAHCIQCARILAHCIQCATILAHCIVWAEHLRIVYNEQDNEVAHCSQCARSVQGQFWFNTSMKASWDDERVSPMIDKLLKIMLKTRCLQYDNYITKWINKWDNK